MDSLKIPSVTGVILAGGRSSRFGSDKTLATWHEKPLIKHLADIFVGLFHSCLIISNSPESHEFLGLPMISDIYSGTGPLGGIHAALKHIQEEKAFILAGDMPLASISIIRYLCKIAEDDQWDFVLPWLIEGQEPLCAVYKKRILPVIEENLQKKKLRLIDLLEHLKVRKVDEAEILTVVDDLSSFHNINRPQDLTDISR